MTERDKAVEAMARAYSFAEHGKDEWADIRYIWKDEEKRCMDAALTALLTLHPSLASVLDGTGVVVPVEATGAMIMRATLATGDDLEPTTDEIRALYRAMLAARPK